jgi:hypothetical protein
VGGFEIAYCRRLGLRVETDRVGNLIVRYRRKPSKAPLVFVAHMDHPGFEMLDGKRAEFLGACRRRCSRRAVKYGCIQVLAMKVIRNHKIARTGAQSFAGSTGRNGQGERSSS